MLRQRHSVKHKRAERRAQKTQPKQQKEGDTAATKVQSASQLNATHSEYVPSLGVLFRILSLVRLAGAVLGPIQDCDEVFNYWEPLHLLQFGTGKQTWEYSAEYALRSYGFIHLYKLLIQMIHFVFGFRSKVQVFFALRICLGLASAGCEAFLVTMVAKWVDKRMGNYLALGLAGMAGMFHTAPALLPSSFAMIVAMVGSAFAMVPPVADWKLHMCRRLVPATAAFAVAAAAGWPYAAIIAVPFVAEELVVESAGCSSGVAWRVRRALALAAVGGGTVAAVVGAMTAVDSWYYRRLVVAPWNQITYNILGSHGGTSSLFGTEPWHFYIKNGLVNANIVMVLALASLPLWTMYRVVLLLIMRRAESPVATAAVARLGNAHWLLLFRMLPFHLTLAVFSIQPHKEERFLSIVYPHMCFCAAAALTLVRPLGAWVATMLGTTSMATAMTGGALRRWRTGYIVLAAAAALGVLRMAALSVYYTAPMKVFAGLAPPGSEVPGLLPLGVSIKALFAPKVLPASRQSQLTQPGLRSATDGNAEREVCMGAGWYWFPSSYWLPPGYRLQFVTGLGEIGGHLPGDFAPLHKTGSMQASTAMERADFNALNLWEPTHAVPLFPAANSTRSSCGYVVDIAVPGSTASFEAALKAQGDGRGLGRWRRIGECLPVLDAARSGLLARVVYVPRSVARVLEQLLGQRQVWAQACVFQQLREPLLSAATAAEAEVVGRMRGG